MASLFWSQATLLVLGSQQIQMPADFFVELVVEVPAAEHSGDSLKDGAHHDSSSNRDIIATVRDHRSASIDSCFFPARVIE